MTPTIEICARAVAHVMCGSIVPEVGMADGVSITTEDIYVARAVLCALRDNISEGMIEAGAFRILDEWLDEEGRARESRAIFTAMLNSALGELS